MGVPVYTKQGWVNGGAPAINGAHLDSMDTQLKAITDWARAGLVDADIAAAAAIAASKLSGYPADATKVLRGDGTWGSAGAKKTTSSWSGGPPASPADQDVWVATGVCGTTKNWTFQYNASEATAYKWIFCGGPSVGKYDSSGGVYQNTAANTWQAVNTLSGISVARGGFYHLEYGGSVVSVSTNTYLGVGPGLAAIYTPYCEVQSTGGTGIVACSASVSMLDSGMSAVSAGGGFLLQMDSATPTSGAIYFARLQILPEKIA